MKTGRYEIVFRDTTVCGAMDFMARLGVIYFRTMIFNLEVEVGEVRWP